MLFKFELTQFRWYRRWKGGSYYLIENWLPMGPFWSEVKIYSCGGRVIDEEHYGKNNDGINKI